jgi:RimJ/RimL family protein N-acetyltransferase
MQQQRARVSLYVKPGISGQGWGRAILKAGERWLRQNRPEVMLIEAEVLSENLASMHVFNAAGFQPGRVLLRKELTRGSD